MLLQTTCERYGYSMEYVANHMTMPQIYLMLDGWNTSNLEEYGIVLVDTRPPRPDPEVDRRGALEWELRHELRLTDELQISTMLESAMKKYKEAAK